jgi:hypothetical protein
MLKNIPTQNFFHTFILTLAITFSLLFISITFPQLIGIFLLLSPLIIGFVCALVFGASKNQKISEIFSISLLSFTVFFVVCYVAISIILSGAVYDFNLNEGVRFTFGMLFYFPVIIYLPIYLLFAMISIFFGNISGFILALKLNR